MLFLLSVICVVHFSHRLLIFIIILFLSLFYSTYDRNGCLAGEVLEAFKYVHNNGGITTDAEYPTVPAASYSVYQKCDLKKKNYSVTVDMTYRIKGEYKMMMYVLSGGTLAVDIDAATWLNYKSGVYSDCSTNFTINHAVNIVGVNVTGKYWIVRNSWGTKWGDKGFMKIQLVSTHLYVCVCTPTYSYLLYPSTFSLSHSLTLPLSYPLTHLLYYSNTQAVILYSTHPLFYSCTFSLLHSSSLTHYTLTD